MSISYEMPEAAYAVGNPIIDREHRRLADTMVALLAAPTGQAAERAAARLVDVWRSHCLEEEELMAAVAYPGLENHKEIHIEFDGILMYLLDCNLGKIRNGHQDVAQFIFDWFVAHVKKCDGPLASFIAAQEKAALAPVHA